MKRSTLSFIPSAFSLFAFLAAFVAPPPAQAVQIGGEHAEILLELLADKPFIASMESSLKDEFPGETMSLNEVKWAFSGGGELVGYFKYSFKFRYDNFMFTGEIPLKACEVMVTLKKYYDQRPSEKSFSKGCKADDPIEFPELKPR